MSQHAPAVLCVGTGACACAYALLQPAWQSLRRLPERCIASCSYLCELSKHAHAVIADELDDGVIVQDGSIMLADLHSAVCSLEHIQPTLARQILGDNYSVLPLLVVHLQAYK